jgi:hypothetical protein
MAEELKIEISGLPEATAKVILMAASNWGCTPDEAALRLLNDEAARRTETTKAA